MVVTVGPHVTKIVRKPKGVGMELKNLTDCDSVIMRALEIVRCWQRGDDKEAVS